MKPTPQPSRVSRVCLDASRRSAWWSLAALAVVLQSGCATARLTDAQWRDKARMSIEYVSVTDFRRPQVGPDGEGGAALHVSKPVWMSGLNFFQASLRVTGLLGFAGTTAMFSAASVNVGADMNFGDSFAFRWYLGPYMATQYLTPGYFSSLGVYYYSGYSFAVGTDPRNRVLLGIVAAIPTGGFGSFDARCPDQDRCAPLLGFTVGYEGMFL